MKQTDPQLKFRVTPDLRERLQQAADAMRRPLNSEIIERLERSFREEDARSDARSKQAKDRLLTLLEPGPIGALQNQIDRRDKHVEDLEKLIKELHAQLSARTAEHERRLDDLERRLKVEPKRS